MAEFGFRLLGKDKKTRARLGEIHTPHGVIHTPAFVPVGTQATVKSLTPDELKLLGVELFFVNTYHAYLRPGIDVINKFNGLHTFMNWPGPLITDSGGFQVFSLGAKKYVTLPTNTSVMLNSFQHQKSNLKKILNQVQDDKSDMFSQLVKIDDDGVTFTSHWDGSQHRFTPEFSVQLQWQLGSDIHIAFDECAPFPTTHEYAKTAMERTHRWAKRSIVEHKYRSDLNKIPYQALYGVIQGSVFKDLRQQSADYITSLDFDGVAIGGVAVGESKEEMKKVCDWVIPRLPVNKPRHLLGVGEIDDIFDSIERGVDTFDCVQPTRLARMGQVYTISNIKYQISNSTIDITKREYAEDAGPLSPDCGCYACKNFSRAYIHHLFRVRELLGYRLTTMHNLHFVLQLVTDIREHLKDGTYTQFKRQYFG